MTTRDTPSALTAAVRLRGLRKCPAGARGGK